MRRRSPSARCLCPSYLSKPWLMNESSRSSASDCGRLGCSGISPQSRQMSNQRGRRKQGSGAAVKGGARLGQAPRAADGRRPVDGGAALVPGHPVQACRAGARFLSLLRAPPEQRSIPHGR